MLHLTVALLSWLNPQVSELRKLFAKHAVASPHEWFQAALAQGCLLLNAGLTASTDGELSTSKHTTFWRPIVAKMVEVGMDSGLIVVGRSVMG
jgi:hypothetical protein